ncbi:phosphoenolpyruvate carboxykinase [Aestuariivirga sp.]|uniref:phosphoenolpyruvate carboxykinase n=1 Tax=Aestuariivirga sp. TaxID=2650926 RepID=UPI003BACE41B
MDTATDALIRAQLAALGLTWVDRISWNAPAAVLYQEAVARGEALVAEGGGLVVTTGPHTGRSPNDKFVVRDEMTERTIWWDNNKPMSPAQFETLRKDFMAHARLKNLFVQDLAAGAEAAYQLPTRVITEFAWHSLFIQHLLIVPKDRTGFAPKLTIIDLPSFKADPARHGTRSETVIALDLANGLVLIGGTQYAGEMKKAVFTVLNFLLPEQGVMPMHCSANVGPKGDSAVFFGLSGTGKTTLSAEPTRTLVGDDEHGWSGNGLFNFEGGCYAKVIKLSKEAEPQIHATTEMWGTVLENVKIDPHTRKLDLHDGALTENTRSAYPLSAIPNASKTGTAPIPQTIVMLTADAFGVMPPIARLTPAQAMYHFLSGYTAKVAGTERGITEPQATFSTCFGAPFIPRDPQVYGELLRDLIARHGVSCWLVNTGWTGGAYGEGHRMPIKVTRSLLNAALQGKLDDVPMRTDPNFGFAVPEAVAGVDPKILNPRATWSDPRAYDAMARTLVGMFVKNFARFEAKVGPEVKAASPAAQIAAE